MGTVGRSYVFRSHATEPMSTVLINPNGNPIEYIPCVADEGNIYAGLAVYRTANTYENEVTRCPADQGQDHLDAYPLLVELEAADQHMDDNYDKDTAYSDGDSIPRCLALYKDMDVWMKMNSGSASQDETLIHGANGLLTNVGDPDGAAIEATAFGYRVLADISSGTWVPVRVLGRITYDDSA